MKHQVERPLEETTLNSLQEILEDKSVNDFAVIEAKVTPATIYNAVKGNRLKPKSFGRITRAVHRLKGSLTKSKAAG